MLGGRAAEKLIFNEMTSGASNDIVQATRLAKAMVVEFGMSELGPINFGPQSEVSEFGAMEWYEGANLAPSTQEKVDDQVKKIIDVNYKRAVILVRKHKRLMDMVVEKLLEKETLDREDFEKIVGRKQNGESAKKI